MSGDKGKPEPETKHPPWQLAFSEDRYLEAYPCFFFFLFFLGVEEKGGKS